MKKLVHYRHNDFESILIGRTAIITPVDHPDSANVSNKMYVMTSPVVAIHANGDFETVNTKYMLINDIH